MPKQEITTVGFGCCLVVMSCLDLLCDPMDLLPGSSLRRSSAYFGWDSGTVSTHLETQGVRGLSPHLGHTESQDFVASKQSGVEEASAQGWGGVEALSAQLHQVFFSQTIG